MSEVSVQQGSVEWHELRQCFALTASKFGEALGVGRGKPYDFLASLFAGDKYDSTSTNTTYTEHGITLEPIINEAYQLLTGHVTKSSGLWLPASSDPLHSYVAASPDAKVSLPANPTKIIGLAEYKAPVHQLYSLKQNSPHGIPRFYMAQIQGQMALTGLPWCDFMAVCESTKDIMLKRVHFNKSYWDTVTSILKPFCEIVKEATERRFSDLEPLDFPRARQLRQKPVQASPFAGERSITVEDLLQRDHLGRFKSKRDAWFYFDFLMGTC